MALQIIHVVLGKANPNRMNGVNKVVHELANHQALEGADVRVWGITKNPVHDYPKRHFTTEVFNDPGKFKLDRQLSKRLAELNAQETMFHFHGAFIPQFCLLARKLQQKGFRYVYTPHGAYNEQALLRSKWRKRIYLELFEKRMVKHAAAIHLIGQSEVTATAKVFGDGNHVLIPNGQPITTPALSEKQNSVPVFGFVGRLDTVTKGLDLLLAAFAQVVEKQEVKPMLFLVGDGPDREELERLARKLNIQEQVQFLGAVFGEEKMKIMANIHFLCLHSRNEGLPGVVLEAAAMGTPVLVSQATNVAETVKQYSAGFATETNTPAAIGQVIEKAIEKIGTDRYIGLSKNAQTMVKEAFNWADIARQHLANYAA